MGFEEAAQKLAVLVKRSVKADVAGEEKVAVAFSGGLDSSIVAACAKRSVTTVGCAAFSKGSLDMTRAREAAVALGIELVTTEITNENVSKELAGIELSFAPTLMDRSLWCLYSLVSKSARNAGTKVILLGQLADELFGGYAKYEEAVRLRGEDVARSMMEADVEEYAQTGRLRDFGACAPWVQPRLPFEQREVVDFGLSLPVSFKIREGVRKAILRRAALIVGVPESIAATAKKAAQYSSGVQKMVANSPF
ncbi:MAG TPA: asparagine synthase C-terminal domain-containing protein [Nitrososphaerales archaeon]|nr:asparagine synthase C-terminal domain-containing protein [Nitrososphaerales archaeon]